MAFTLLAFRPLERPSHVTFLPKKVTNLERNESMKVQEKTINKSNKLSAAPIATEVNALTSSSLPQ